MANIVDYTNLVKTYIDKKTVGTVYGFIIDSNESDPSDCITYTNEAVGMTPAYMDYTNDVFNYGSWENAFFMPRPCMLKSDGTVDYYLDPNDYTKKEDGTASDVANTAYDGNAMMEWGQNGKKIWWKFTPLGDGTSAKFQVADYQANEGFHDWNFHNANGVSIDHFYTPIYSGSVTDGVMRSLSGQQVSKSLPGTTEISYAEANNPTGTNMWYIDVEADDILIRMLLVLMSKNLDTQEAFGQGLTNNGTEAINDAFRTGVHNAKGLFYGTNSGTANVYTNAVKVFGMENQWGFQWRRKAGLILANGVYKIKLTYNTEDGSSTVGYNTDGTNYINTQITAPSANGTYIDKMTFTKDGFFPTSASGTASTYYGDGLWTNFTTNAFALAGGSSADGARCGAFSSALNLAVGVVNWHSGARISCKPLA